MSEDTAYKGYDIDKRTGQVVEFYDHRDKHPESNASTTTFQRQPYASEVQQPLLPPPTFVTTQNAMQPTHQPIVMLEEHKKTNSGCCGSCIQCCDSCGKLPCSSILSFFLLLIGGALLVVCAWLVIEESDTLFREYGPPRGNPVFDDPPEWIKISGNNIGWNWEKVRGDEFPGNYYPQVQEGLEYTIIALAPFLFVLAILFLVTAFQANKDINKRSTYTAWSSVSEMGICCTMFLTVLSWFLLIAFVIWACFNTLGIYYYRMVAERCWDLNDRNFGDGVKKNICIDLVQIGLVRWRETDNKGYGKICGPGNNVGGIKEFGDLEGYCENYQMAYIYMILAFVGVMLVIIALLNYAMIFSTKYTILTRKYVKKYVKMDAIELDRTTAPPTHAPTVMTNFQQPIPGSAIAPGVRAIPQQYSKPSPKPRGSPMVMEQIRRKEQEIQSIAPASNIRKKKSTWLNADEELANFYRD